MWKSEFETMTFENTSDFRKLLRRLSYQIQEICFFYSNSNFQIDYFYSFSQQIDDIFSQILHFDQFSERRRPIQGFYQILQNFQNTFQSHYDEFFINIKESLNEILKNGLENQEIIQVSNFDLKNSLNWEQFCEPLQGLNTGSNPDFIKRITIISNKGKAISSIYDIFAQFAQFYIDFPKEMSDEEKEKIQLIQKIRFLEGQVNRLKKDKQILETENKSVQSKYHVLQISYQNMISKYEESKQKIQGELDELNKSKDLADAQISQIKEFFMKYRKQIDDEEEFDPDSFSQFIKDNQDDFEDIMDELDL